MRPVRVCHDCFTMLDENTNLGTVESSPKSTNPISIQNGCRQTNGTPNGSFNSGGGQKVKG